MKRQSTAACRTVLALAAALLIVGAVACVLDVVHGGGDHHAAPDLCLLTLAVPAVALLPLLLEVGSAPSAGFRQAVAVAVPVPAPPPKRPIP